MSVAFFMDWFAYDVDGTIASRKSDLDGIVVPSDSGATDPQSSIQLAMEVREWRRRRVYF